MERLVFPHRQAAWPQSSHPSAKRLRLRRRIEYLETPLAFYYIKICGIINEVLLLQADFSNWIGRMDFL